MSLEAVAKVTKIQPRILERLEDGKLDGLPAEVFVRGFVRSFARCVGLDEDEALRRFAGCGLGAGSADLTPTVRALVEAMVDLAPGSPSTPRATPRRMQAVEPPELRDVPESPELPESLRASAPGLAAGDAVVETMMLPETGTVVMPAQLSAMIAEAVAASPARAAEPMPIAPSTLPAGSFDALPIAELPAAEAPVAAPAAGASELCAADAADAPAVEPIAAEPVAAEPVVAVAVAVEPIVSAATPESSKKKRGRKGKGRGKRGPEGTTGTAGMSRDLLATGTPSAASPVVAAKIEADTASAVAAPSAAIDAVAATSDEPIATETWAPKMPPMAAPQSVPWRRPAYAAAPSVVVPSLVIDDADPDSAERVLEERAETLTPRRSFLPPILLDREDRSARQGGLTLAVIILLIAATLTLSYLMRRPSASGDGMTRREAPASQQGASSVSDPSGIPARG